MERPIPQPIDAEKAVLGSIIMDPGAIAEVMYLVTPADFYRDEHSFLYRIILDLYAQHGPADLVTICNELERRDLLRKIGGQGYIAELQNSIPTSANAAYYARIVQRAAVGRRLIHVAGQIAALGYNQADDMTERAFKLVIDAASARGTGTEQDFSDVLDELLEEVDRRMEGDLSQHVLYTGLPALDDMTGGMERKELILVAGRPGTGKSVFGLEVAVNAAKQLRQQGGTVFYYNLEMSGVQQVRRLIASKAHINGQMIRHGFRDGAAILEDEYSHFSHKAEELRELLRGSLYLYSKPISVDDLDARLSTAVMTKNCRFVVIDQLDLFEDFEHDREHDQISYTSKRLKQIALDLDITILCLVQLSREVEHRPGIAGKRPVLPDLRYSGRLEQDADQVWFLFRPSLYEQRPQVPNWNRYAECIAGKMREGPRGTIVPFCFLEEYTAIEAWPREWGRPILDDKEGK